MILPRMQRRRPASVFSDSFAAPKRAATRVPVANALRVALYVVALLYAEPARSDTQITVFAAASLTDAVTRIADVYRNKTGIRSRVSFASSSTLARQIEAGAGAQIFMAANRQWMDYLEARDRIEPQTRIAPIANALALIAPAASSQDKVAISPGLRIAALLGPRERLAIGDPAHVPAGIYARQALVALGQWPSLERRLAYTDNVRAALALVGRGEAALGIVYRTDALLSGAVETIGIFPADSHSPIVYPFAIVSGHEQHDVRNLFDFVVGPEGLDIFEGFGFVRN